LSAQQLLEEDARPEETVVARAGTGRTSAKLAAFLAFAREFRQCLEAYFEMAEKIA
jgi:hypothetical protein